MRNFQPFKYISNKYLSSVCIVVLFMIFFVGHVSAKNINIQQDNVSQSIIKVWDIVVEKVEKIKREKINSDNIATNSNNSNSNNQNNLKQNIEFSDIEKNPYKYSIKVLHEKNLVKGYKDKYFPGNHVRMSMLLKVLINSYNNVTDNNVYLDTNRCIDTAYKMGLLNNIVDLTNNGSFNYDFESIVSYYNFKQILRNFAYQYPSLIVSDFIDKIPGDNNILTKDKMAYYIVNSLSMLPDSREGDVNKRHYFKDTAYHVFGDDVEFLAGKGIITLHDDNFFIDKLANRADLVVLISNTLSKLRGENIGNYDDLDINIIDILNKPYKSQIIYANKEGLINYLIETKRGKSYLYPEQLLTKHEAYYILGLASGKTLDYNIDIADYENITRGELSHIIFDAFDFDNTYKYIKKTSFEHNSFDNVEFINLSGIKTLGFLSKIKTFFSNLNEIRI